MLTPGKLPVWAVMRSVTAIVVITMAVLLVLARVTYPLIAEQREQIQLWASEAAGYPIRIEQVEVSRTGLSPQFSLSGLQIMAGVDASQPLIEFQQVRVTISLWRSLWEWRLSPSQIVIVGPEFELERNLEERVQLVGFVAEGAAVGDSQGLYDWLLSRPAIHVEDARIRWRDLRHPGSDLTLQAVDFSLSNQGDEHRLSGRLGGAAGSPVDGLQFQWVLTGASGSVGSWQGALYFRAEALQLGELPYLRNRLSGQFSGEAWVSHQGLSLESLVFNLRGKRLLVRGDQAEDLSLEQINGRMHWARQADGWRFQLHDFEAQVGDHLWPGSWLELAQVQSGGQERRLQWRGDRLDLALAEQMGRWLAQQRGVEATLPVSGLGGVVEQFDGAIDLNAEGKVTGYAFSGLLKEVVWQTTESLPGVSGLNLQLEIDSHTGRAHWANGGLTIDATEWFTAPLTVTASSGLLTWSRDATGALQIDASETQFATPDFTATAAVAVALPIDGAAPEVDATLQLGKLAVTRVPTYLPLKLFSPALGGWLESALLTGEVSSSRIRLQGSLDQFPFRQGGGLFEVRSQVVGVDLNYQKAWPHLRSLSGELIFTGVGMQGQFSQGQLLQTRLQGVDVKLPYARDQRVLAVNGLVKGPNSAFLQFLAESPLASRFAGLASSMQLEGDGELNLALRIPLMKGAKYGVGGVVRIAGADLFFPAIKLRIQDVQGEIGISQAGVWADGLRGQLLGGSVTADLATGSGVTEVRAKGILQAAELQTFVGLANANARGALFSGETAWNGVLSLDSAGLGLELQSELGGFALSAPEPLGKPAAESRLFRLSGRHEGRQLTARMELGPDLSVELTADQDELGWLLSDGLIQAGHVGAEVREARTTAAGQFTVSTDLPELSLDDWLSWLKAQGLLSGGSGRLPPLALSLRAGRAVFLDRGFDQFSLAGRRQGPLWQFDVDSQQVAGYAEFDPVGFGRVVADLERLHLEPSLGRVSLGPAAPGTESPDGVPELDINAQEFEFKGWPLGKLRLQAVRTPDQLRIEQLNLDMGLAGTLALSGLWQGVGPTQAAHTAVSGALRTWDFGGFVRRIDLGENLSGGKGVIDIDLNWPGAPASFSSTVVSGALGVNLRKGAVSAVNPGLGRVLGLLSLDAIKRRLKLNFGDVLGEGLAYDTLIGGYQISQGQADTDGLVLDGPAVRVAVTGVTDFGSDRFDLQIVTEPKVSGGLNTAVAIASPVVGAAMFLGRKLLGPSIDQLAGNHYRVTGSWDEPLVTAVKAPAKSP